MTPEPLPLTVACWDYDRTAPLIDRRIPLEGCAPRFTILPPQVVFPRAFTNAEWDVSELSLSRHAQSVAMGTHHYAGLPIFLSRAFRHGSIYIRTDRGIDNPAGLRGRRIGLRNFDDTAVVVVRGMLRDQYGLGPADVVWVVGDMEPGGPARVAPPPLHAPIPLDRLANGDTLDAALVEGRLDGLIALRPPPCFVLGHPGVGRLFTDWCRAEQDYHRATDLFPIMHLVGVRASLAADTHPRCPDNAVAVGAGHVRG